MRTIFKAFGLSIASVALSATLATPASAAPETALGWEFWDSYPTSRQCNNVGAFGILGGAWSDYACSFTPVDETDPYWLYVYL
jgi:hypothetical protein